MTMSNSLYSQFNVIQGYNIQIVDSIIFLVKPLNQDLNLVPTTIKLKDKQKSRLKKFAYCYNSDITQLLMIYFSITISNGKISKITSNKPSYRGVTKIIKDIFRYGIKTKRLPMD